MTAADLKQQVLSTRSKGFYWEELEWNAAILLLGLQLPPLVFLSGNTSAGLELHNHLSCHAAQQISRGLVKGSVQVSPQAILALPAEVGIVVCTVRNGLAVDAEHFEVGLRGGRATASSSTMGSGSPAAAHASASGSGSVVSAA